MGVLRKVAILTTWYSESKQQLLQQLVDYKSDQGIYIALQIQWNTYHLKIKSCRGLIKHWTSFLSDLIKCRNDWTVFLIMIFFFQVSLCLYTMWHHKPFISDGQSSQEPLLTVTATAVNAVGHSLVAHFSDVTLKGTLTALIPNTIYAIQAEAVDKNGITLAETQVVQSTG